MQQLGVVLSENDVKDMMKSVGVESTGKISYSGEKFSVTIKLRSPPIGWARQNAAQLKFYPKPFEAAFSDVISKFDK